MHTITALVFDDFETLDLFGPVEMFGSLPEHYLILHGRYTCQARTPKCGACPVYEECMFKDKAMFLEL